MRTLLTVLAAGALLGPSIGRAAAASEAYTLWQAGRYNQAIAAGEVENTPDGWSIAAGAAVSEMTLQSPPCLGCVKRTETIARKAVAIDPKGALPHVYLAISLGYKARIVGMLQAERDGLAIQSRREIDAALAADPKNALAEAALGGWNMDTVRIGGAMLARWTYGATTDDGIAAFNRAAALNPADIVVHYQFALSLAGIDPDRYRSNIQAQLSSAIAGAPNSVYDAAMQKRAVILLQLISAGNERAFAQTVRSDMGIPQ